MICNVQQLLTDGRCFAAMNSRMRMAAMVQLWCDVSPLLAALNSNNPAVQNVDDLLWYQFNITQLSPGVAVANIGQVPVSAGANAYLVIFNLTDGFKYKVQLWGAPPNVDWQIDPAATVEAETPTVLSAGGANYDLDIVTDGGLTIELNPVP